MKKIGLILLSFIFAFSLFAQEEKATKIKLGKKKYIVISEGNDEIIVKDLDDDLDFDFDFDFEDNFKFKKKRKSFGKMNGHWEGLEIGLNTFANPEFDFGYPDNVDYMDLNTNKSIALNLNLGEKSFGIIRNYVGIVTGWGFEMNHYSFSDNVTLENVDGITSAVIDPDMDYKKNRLGTCYLTVPLMLEFQIPVSGEHKRLYLSGGVVGGLRILSRQIQKYEIDGDKTRNKVKDDFNLNGFRYGLTARLGYGSFGFFANYSMTPLFKDGSGPEIYPFTFGITLSH